MSSRTRTPTAGRLSRKAGLAAAARLLTAALAESGPPDPLVLLWREWRKTLGAFRRQCRETQRLERLLMERIGFPRVEVPVQEADRSLVFVTEAQEIDRLLGTTPATSSLRARLTRDLAAAQARWDAEAEASGLTAASAREAATDRRIDEMLRAAATTPARSMMGTVAKLAIAAEWGLSEPETDGHPWTFLCSVLADLTAMAASSRTQEIGRPNSE